MFKFKNLIILFSLLFVFIIPKTYADEVGYINVDYDSNYVKNKLHNNFEYLEIAHELADHYININNLKYAITIVNNKVNFIITPANPSNTYISNSFYSTLTRIYSTPNDIGFYNYVEISEDNLLSVNEYLSLLSSYTKYSQNFSKIFYPSDFLSYEYLNKGFNLYEDSKNIENFNGNIIYETNLNYKITSNSDMYLKFNNGNLTQQNDPFLTYVDVMGRYTDEVIPVEPESNLYSINTLANLTNGFITTLYGENISFYEILISLFIFNVIMYIIRAIICDI